MKDKAKTPHKPKSAPRKTKTSTKARTAADAKYEVGYGKPPAASRFVKGRSGNPLGRPRKSKPRRIRLSDAVSDKILEQEVYRTITIRENGEPIDLTVLEALMRSIANNALKGNRLSQKYLLEYVARAEEQAFQRKVSYYQHLSELKRKGEQALAEHRRRGWPPPDLLPHPDDIVLVPATGEAYVKGPETPEDLPLYEHTARLRDHMVLCSAHWSECFRRPYRKTKDDKLCAYLLFAQMANRMLPARFRWPEDGDLTLMLRYMNLSHKERERMIAAESAELIRTAPKLTLITPEMDAEIDRMMDKVLRRREDAAA